jgi:hypothetical protein
VVTEALQWDAQRPSRIVLVRRDPSGDRQVCMKMRFLQTNHMHMRHIRFITCISDPCLGLFPVFLSVISVLCLCSSVGLRGMGAWAYCLCFSTVCVI